MKIASYWVREKREIAGMVFRLRGYSFRSVEEARARLEEKAKLHAALYEKQSLDAAEYRARLRRLDEQASETEYSVVIAEEILERVDECNTITRNRYGAEVLNSRDTCFLDIDSFAPGLMSRVLRFFGRKKGDEDLLLQTVHELCAAEPELGIRVYRTAKGWRLAVTAPGLSPASATMEHLCKRLRVDALYQKLCVQQGCWRARLTPKPRRVGMPCVYPQPQASDASSPAAEEWLALYRRQSAGAAVCRLVETVGKPMRGEVIRLHDNRTGAAKQDYPLC